MKSVPHCGQWIDILPRPLGTLSLLRHLGHEKSVPIVIDKIYLGLRVDDIYNPEESTNETFYRELIKRLCPNVVVEKMRAEDFDGHHIDTLSMCNKEK